MPYSPLMIRPMREELAAARFEDLMTPDQVDTVLGERSGTALLVVNSVCGCAAGMARPGVKMAIQHERIPDRIATVFAGVDREATERARSYMPGYPPSSPSIALFKDGKLVFMMERWQIEGRAAEEIAEDLVTAFERYCATQD